MNQSSVLNESNQCGEEACYSDFSTLLMLFIESDIYKFAIGTIWISLVFFGVLGNGLVIFIAIYYKKLNDITNCYIFNLAITDLLFVVFCIPFTTYIYLFDNWFFGVTFCKLNHFMSHASVQSTCLTLTAMTIHRCNLIIKNKTLTQHISNIKQRQKTVLLITICIWIVSFIIASPDLVYYTVTFVNDTNESFKMCSYDTQTYSILKSYISVSHIVSISTTYVIPLLIIILSYTRLLSHLSKNQRRLAKFNRNHEKVKMTQLVDDDGGRKQSDSKRIETPKLSKKSRKSENRKKKVTTMVAVVTLNFGICWLPTHLFIILKRALNNYSHSLFPYLALLKMFAHTLSYLTPVINPCLYAFYNENFRQSFYDLWFRITCKRDQLNSKKMFVKSNSKSVY